jgi:hypothetical protein
VFDALPVTEPRLVFTLVSVLRAGDQTSHQGFYQGGLANAGLAGNEDDLSLALPGLLEPLVESGQFSFAPYQNGGRGSGTGWRKERGSRPTWDLRVFWAPSG